MTPNLRAHRPHPVGHAFPMRLRSQTIEALNVFGDVKGGNFDGADVPIVQALADATAIPLLQERAIHRGVVLTEQLQGGLSSRIVIEQAKGAIAHQISVEEAFNRIRKRTRGNGRNLIDVAHAIITGQTTISESA